VYNPTDLTYESAFPNLTNEELHVSLSNFQLNHDESSIGHNSGSQINNNTINNTTHSNQ